MATPHISDSSPLVFTIWPRTPDSLVSFSCKRSKRYILDIRTAIVACRAFAASRSIFAYSARVCGCGVCRSGVSGSDGCGIEARDSCGLQTGDGLGVDDPGSLLQ